MIRADARRRPAGGGAGGRRRPGHQVWPGTTTSGMGERCTSPAATLPSSAALTEDRPREPITIAAAAFCLRTLDQGVADVPALPHRLGAGAHPPRRGERSALLGGSPSLLGQLLVETLGAGGRHRRRHPDVATRRHRLVGGPDGLDDRLARAEEGCGLLDPTPSVLRAVVGQQQWSCRVTLGGARHDHEGTGAVVHEPGGDAPEKRRFGGAQALGADHDRPDPVFVGKL